MLFELELCVACEAVLVTALQPPPKYQQCLHRKQYMCQHYRASSTALKPACYASDAVGMVE
jgi:hypothetical protein